MFEKQEKVLQYNKSYAVWKGYNHTFQLDYYKEEILAPLPVKL